MWSRWMGITDLVRSVLRISRFLVRGMEKEIKWWRGNPLEHFVLPSKSVAMRHVIFCSALSYKALPANTVDTSTFNPAGSRQFNILSLSSYALFYLSTTCGWRDVKNAGTRHSLMLSSQVNEMICFKYRVAQKNAYTLYSSISLE